MSNKLIISVLSLVAGVAVIFLLLSPRWAEVKGVQARAVKLEEHKAGLEQFLKKSRELETKYAEVKAEAESAFLALPPGEDVLYLIVQFSEMAKANGLLLGGIGFGALSEDDIEQGAGGARRSVVAGETGSSGIKDAFPSFSASLSLTGSYGAFKNYLISLENAARAVNVGAITLSPGGLENDQATSGVFDFSLAVKAYYQK